MDAPAADAPLILIADDVPANVELLADQLQVLGYRTCAAGDGPEALRTAVDAGPDLCILDVSMPAGDLGVPDRATGFEVCRRLKRDPRTARIPVIFVTALNDTADRVKAIEAGGDDFLTKPHNRLVLGARVRSLLRLKRTTDALEDSIRKLRELEKVRDDLMKMIVHDLKSPLTSVLATLEMVADGDFGDVNARQHGVLLDAQAKSEELLALIDDLLEIARIEEGAMALDPAPMVPAAFLEGLRADWALRCAAAGAQVGIDVSPGAPAFVADRALLRRVFGNLLQNAITHAHGPVRVRLGVRRDGDAVLFTVADDGPGIAPEYQELIFRKFETVRMQGGPRPRSSGLGLTFCRLAVEAHGGRIWVQSALGTGSQFHVRLPLEPAPPGRDGR
ncbi:MAG TPA: ATP-binding protein [Gemmatirosa sp.]|nr:ATP-binding protein [Gemmatirosa sp.]